MDHLLYLGVNASWEHQKLITRLSGELYILFKEGKILYEQMSEKMIDSQQTSEVPDIMPVGENEKAEVIIEVTTAKTKYKDILKAKSLVTDYRVNEAFVYDYQEKKWHKITLEAGEVLQNPSFCETINCDPARLIP